MPTFTYVFDMKLEDIIEKKTEITSPQFRTHSSEVFFDWQLSFLPIGDENLPSIQLELKKCSENFSRRFVSTIVRFKLVTTEHQDDIFVGYVRFGLTSSNGICQKSTARFTGFNFDGEVPNSVKIYPGNVFKIVCKILITRLCFYPFDRQIAAPHFLVDNAASKLFNKITSTGDSVEDFLSDVTLTSSDSVEFKCHRFVLSANSTVFSAMFSNKNFQETNNFPFKVEISDIDSKALKELLRFMYTKDVSKDLAYVVEQVVYGSEKYDLQELKMTCEHALKFGLNSANIFHYFEIAYKYRLDSLMTDCCKMYRIYFHLFDENNLRNFYARLPQLVSTIFQSGYEDEKNNENRVF